MTIRTIPPAVPLLPALALLLPLAAGAASAAPAHAAPAEVFDFAGTKRIVAHTRDGQDIAIGTVSFTPQGDPKDGTKANGTKAGRYAYALDMDMRPFQEFFLSMRQFKCLPGPDITCYVPYPYPNPHTVTASDLAWLEHDLLFFWKAPNDYGAKLGNGLIYKFRQDGKALVGRPEAINLDAIASPPADTGVPPYGPADRDEIADGTRYVSSLSIE